MKKQFMAASAMALLTMLTAVSPATGQVLPFNGRLENEGLASPPADGRCVAPNPFPRAKSSPTGTSNISTFTSLQSHCSSSPATSAVNGLFTYTFEAGDTIFGTYSANIDSSIPRPLSSIETLVIQGGTGRFVGATGTIDSMATFRRFGGEDFFGSILTGSLTATTTTASGTFATAFGVPSAATGDYSTAIGAFSIAPGARSTAVGAFADAPGAGAVALGSHSFARGEKAVAIGEDARAVNVSSLAIGNGAFSSGTESVAIGARSSAVGFGSVAIGAAAIAAPNAALAIGSSSSAGLFATAVGNSASAVLQGVALGGSASATAQGASALGSGARAEAQGAVALGQGSLANQANTVSVGTVGGERRIVNVASGTATTDAVNLGQLSATNAGLASLSTMVDDLSFDIRSTGREARSGTAAALAAAGLPQAQGVGRTMIAGGVGTYRGRTALAVGASHRLQNGNGTFKLGVTYDSSEHSGANAGFGFEF